MVGRSSDLNRPILKVTSTLMSGICNRRRQTSCLMFIIGLKFFTMLGLLLFSHWYTFFIALSKDIMNLRLRPFSKYFFSWAKTNSGGIFLYNLILFIIILLKSAGYFYPFVTLSNNLIVLFSAILAIPLLRAGERMFFLLALTFIFIASFFEYWQVLIWSERSAMYSFEMLLIGMLLYVFRHLPILSKERKELKGK